MADMNAPDVVGLALTRCVSQVLERICQVSYANKNKKQSGARWYDKELRQLRGAAIQAGERIETVEDFNELKTKTAVYKSTKQRKQRSFKYKCIENIKNMYGTDKRKFWKLLSDASSRNGNEDRAPTQSEFLGYFKKPFSKDKLELF
jgi:hypothetical protein